MTDGTVGGASGDFEKTRERVTGLVLAEGWKIQQANSPDAAWVFLAEAPDGKKVFFGQSPNHPGYVEIQANVRIDPTHQKQFAALGTEQLETFLWDLRFKLLGTGVRFSGLRQPFEGVGFRDRVFQDELETMGGLHRALERVTDAMLVLVWSLHRQLGQGPPPEQKLGFEVN